MAKFKIVNISLGKLKAKQLQFVYFPYEGVRKIVKMVSPCDCSVPVNEASNSRIMVKYIPKKVSEHLTQQGIKEQAIKKEITIIYVDQETGNEETIILSFNAVIHN